MKPSFGTSEQIAQCRGDTTSPTPSTFKDNMTKKTSFAFLMLAAAAVFPIQSQAQTQTYSVQKFGGQTILVPQGVIKSGPRSYSAFDPSNPYRTAKDYTGRTGYERAASSQLPVINRNGNCRVEPRGVTGGVYFGNGPVIIVNPFVK
jgi:hypothetical protein